MSAMQSLKYTGDPSKWKIDAMTATREIFDAGVTMEHFVLQCIMQSFKGASRDVQGQITRDINNIQKGERLNFEELYTKYVRYLSTLNAGRDSSVGGVKEDETAACRRWSLRSFGSKLPVGRGGPRARPPPRIHGTPSVGGASTTVHSMLVLLKLGFMSMSTVQPPRPPPDIRASMPSVD